MMDYPFAKFGDIIQHFGFIKQNCVILVNYIE